MRLLCSEKSGYKQSLNIFQALMCNIIELISTTSPVMMYMMPVILKVLLQHIQGAAHSDKIGKSIVGFIQNTVYQTF